MAAVGVRPETVPGEANASGIRPGIRDSFPNSLRSLLGSMLCSNFSLTWLRRLANAPSAVALAAPWRQMESPTMPIRPEFPIRAGMFGPVRTCKPRVAQLSFAALTAGA